MLRRLEREGSLRSLGPWEMRTVRSLLERGLVRPRLPGRTSRETSGLWFLSAKGSRILALDPVEASDAAPRPHTAATEMSR